MNDNLIFAYFMGISNHMWDDENTPARGYYLEPKYTPENNIDIKTWDDTVSFLAEHKYNMVLIDVGDGIRYESRPEISAPDAWDKDFLKKKLDELRALGIEPIPKLNFSCCHHTWLKEYRRMVSTPMYYSAVSDVIREVAEAFGNPRFFHLGMDEENLANQAYRESVHIRHDALWWHDAYFYFNEVEKYGCRPWVWADYCWDFPDTYLAKMPKSVLQSNWFYRMFRDYPQNSSDYKAIHTYDLLGEHGFDQIPCGSCWDQAGATNVLQTLLYGKNRIPQETLKGYMVAAWQTVAPKFRYQLQSDAYAMYVARREVYPETL